MTAEPPVCAGCGGRHWFLDPCGTREPLSGPEAFDVALRKSVKIVSPGPLAATATVDEIEKALKYYRAHKSREAARQRAKRAAPHKG